MSRNETPKYDIFGGVEEQEDEDMEVVEEMPHIPEFNLANNSVSTPEVSDVVWKTPDIKYAIRMLQRRNSSSSNATSESYVPPQPTNTSGSSGVATRKKVVPLPSSTVSSGSVSANSVRTPVRRPPVPSRSNSSIVASSSCATTPQVGESFIIAVVEGRRNAKGEIGLACINLKNPVLILSQFTDSHAYVKLLRQLHIFNPTEIIVPNTTFNVGSSSKLVQFLTENVSTAKTVTVQRKYFNENTGLHFIQRLCLPEYKTVLLEVDKKYYCLASCAALLRYVEFIQKINYAPSCLKIAFQVSKNTVMIDTSTARHLELVMNLSEPKSHNCLFGILNKTITVGGSRLLRANILQPPSDKDTIECRLAGLDELMQSEELFENLKVTLQQFVDLEQILNLCVIVPKDINLKAIEHKITNVVHLKHVLDYVEPLKNALKKTQNVLFQTYLKDLDDPRFAELKTMISEVIHCDARRQRGALNIRMQKCFAVKQNINGLLDIARRMFTEIVNDISDLVSELASTHKLPLRLGYSAAKGFHIQITNAPPILPNIFVKVSKRKRITSCFTNDLIRLNACVDSSLTEIYLMSNVIINELLKEIRGSFGCLYKLSEALSMMDYLLSLAHYCALNPCVRPEFSDILAIKNGCHPVLQKTSSQTVIPNDTFISSRNNFLLVTGPNMSGKTTYLKQVALLQIMSQMGSFIPAEFATIRLVDQIFSRMGSSDSIENNSSTFIQEMNEASYIMTNMTKNSLIIIDELGIGSDVDEGISIAWAFCEEILLSPAFTLFTTHYKELARLESMYPNVNNFHLVVDYALHEESQAVVSHYTYTLEGGVCEDENYGLKFANMTSMPKSIIESARAISQLQKNERLNFLLTAEEKRRRMVIELAVHLQQLAHSPNVCEDTMRQYLKQLKEKYLENEEDDMD